MATVTDIRVEKIENASKDAERMNSKTDSESHIENVNKVDKQDLSMTVEKQFEQVLHKDRQQNLRLSRRNESGTRYNGFVKRSVETLVGKPTIDKGCCWIAKDRMRYIVIFMGLLAIVLNQMSRVVVNVTIPLMTYPVNSTNQSSKDSCPLEESTASTTTIPFFKQSVFHETDSHFEGQAGIKKFDWSPAQQDQLLGAFFYTYSSFQIPGGVLAERYGSKYIICASVAVSGLSNLITPWMAKQDFGLKLLIISRLIVGVAQASLLPAVYALMSKWITGTEIIVISSILKMAFRLGALLGSVVPGLVAGWEPSYYITGVLCMIWTVFWLFLSTSRPQDNSCVSFNELFRIARKKNDRNIIMAAYENNLTTESKPKFMVDNNENIDNSPNDRDDDSKTCEPTRFRVWFVILTSRSVIGFVLCKLTVNLTTDFLTSIMPTYIRDLHHGDKTKISLINSLLALVQVLVSFPISWLIKYTNESRPFGLKTTGMRRLFTSVLCFGSALFLSLLTVVSCDLVYASVMLHLLAVANMLGGGGEALIPNDLSDEYPATIAALGNSFSSISGFVIPSLKTAIIGKQTDSVSAWNHYILTIAFLQAIGGLIFIFTVKAKKLDFSNKPSITEIKQLDLEATPVKHQTTIRNELPESDNGSDSKKVKITEENGSESVIQTRTHR